MCRESTAAIVEDEEKCRQLLKAVLIREEIGPIFSHLTHTPTSILMMMQAYLGKKQESPHKELIFAIETILQSREKDKAKAIEALDVLTSQAEYLKQQLFFSSITYLLIAQVILLLMVFQAFPKQSFSRFVGFFAIASTNFLTMLIFGEIIRIIYSNGSKIENLRRIALGDVQDYVPGSACCIFESICFEHNRNKKMKIISNCSCQTLLIINSRLRNKNEKTGNLSILQKHLLFLCGYMVSNIQNQQKTNTTLQSYYFSDVKSQLTYFNIMNGIIVVVGAILSYIYKINLSINLFGQSKANIGTIDLQGISLNDTMALIAFILLALFWAYYVWHSACLWLLIRRLRGLPSHLLLNQKLIKESIKPEEEISKLYYPEKIKAPIHAGVAFSQEVFEVPSGINNSDLRLLDDPAMI